MCIFDCVASFLCRQYSIDKWTFQMIHANKADKEQITKGFHVGLAGLSVCALLYVCVSVSVKEITGPRGWSIRDPRQNEDISRAFSAGWCYLHFHSFLCIASLDLQHEFNSLGASVISSLYIISGWGFILKRTIKWLYASTIVILTPEQICTENILNNNFHLCWELQRGRTRTEMCFMNL